jgi:hypothetical protein
MIKFKQMTREHGDLLQEFTRDDAGIAAAEARFKELTGSGFFAWAPATDGGPAKQVRSFDPNAGEIVFQPQLKGG